MKVIKFIAKGTKYNRVNILLYLILYAFISSAAFAEQLKIPGRNVNIIGPPPLNSMQIPDKGLRQQNEPSCAVNPVNPTQICCGFNDYRGIDIPEIGDAWEGLSCSRDTGKSWNSQLIPGHGADPVYNMNLDFAADPNLVSAPGGLFYNFIAADRDHVGGIYLQRFAWRNKEDGWPLAQVGGPILISKGTNGRFIDKPHMIGFLNDLSSSTVNMNWSDVNGNQSRVIPAGNLGMAAAVFVGNDNNDGTKILYWNSDDWGRSWNKPTKLSESKGVNSGVNIATNGDNICIVWRRFDDTNESSSILFSCSSNRGKKFTKAKVLYQDMCPFDQTTLNGVAPSPKDIVSFRTNAFPVIASDGNKFYTFWSDRGFAKASNGQAGCSLRDANNNFNPSYGRIVYSVTSNNGKSWSNPKMVEDVPQGHQFMPAAFGANGEVVISWIDNRDDIANFLAIDKQLIVDFWKDDLALYRHTTDIRSARLNNTNNTSFSASVKVSNYTKGIHRNSAGDILGLRQMEFNLVNARLFKQGTAPFIGDYLSVTANAYNKDASGKWQNSNTAPTVGSPTFHISWGDNRDVRGNAWGNADEDGFSEPSTYTPTTTDANNNSNDANSTTSNATPSVQDPNNSLQLTCDISTKKADRTRDQNIYSAPLYPIVSLRSPGSIKVTGVIQRALPVYIENFSAQTRYFRLEITAQPSDYGQCTGIASFKQTTASDSNTQCGEVSAIWVKLYPKSSAVRTVFQSSNTNDLHHIPIDAFSCEVDSSGAPNAASCELVSRVVLNQDLLELGNNLEQPDFDTVNDILSQELHNPDLLNPDLLNTRLLSVLLQNPDLLNPDLLNPDLLNPDLLNPDLLNPDLLNLILLNPDLLNSELLNLMIENPDLLNPDLLNTLVSNPDLLNPDLLNLVVVNPDLLNPDLLNLLIANPDLTNAELTNLSIANPDLLNPDLLNLIITNPDLLNPDLLNIGLANPDLLNPDLLNPDLLNPDLLNLMVANPDLLNPDLLNPDLLNLSLTNPDLLNPDLLNPDLLNPDLLNPDLLNLILLNPDLLNPDLLNPDLLNPDLLNPDLLNPDLLNLIISNPDLLNPDLLNPDLLNPDLLNPDLLNTTISYADIENPDVANDALTANANQNYIDVTWQVKNDGNTTTGYMAQTYIAGPEEHTATQLIVSKPYLRQTTRNCMPVLESDNQVVVNIYNPTNQEPIINPDPQDDNIHGLASYWLNPGQVANITLRVFADNPVNLHSGRVGLYVNSQACNTKGGCDNKPFEITRRKMDILGPIFTPNVINDLPSVEATGPEGGIVTFDTPQAYDDGDAKEIPVTCDYESGNTVPLGSTDNICTAIDSVGNSTEIGFNILVEDSTPPTLNFIIPTGVMFPIEAQSPLGTIVNFISWVTSSDLVDPNPSISCTSQSGSFFSLGTTIVTCSATDANGNVSSSTLNIAIADTTPPVLTVPQNALSAEATSSLGAIAEFDISVSDIADANVSYSCSHTSGSIFPLGNNIVTCTATDTSGNNVIKTFDVNIVDSTPPELTVPEDIVVSGQTSTGAIVNYQVSALDIADDIVDIVCTPLSGSEFPFGETQVNCTATDNSGLSSSATFNIFVQRPTSIIWLEPTAEIATGKIGPNFTFRWGYGTSSQLIESKGMINTSPGKGTDPLSMHYLGVACGASSPEIVDIDAGKSSLRYSSLEWRLNWQTGQSTLNGESLSEGCYELKIPRSDTAIYDIKRVILSN